MDLSKFKTSDWLKVGGAIGFLIAFFLTWWSSDIAEARLVGFEYSGSSYFFTGVIPFILVVAVGILTLLAVTGKYRLPNSLPAPLLFLGATALSTLLVLIRFTGDGHSLPDEANMSRGFGLILALIAAIVATVGSVMGFKESGGDLNDLKDMNKIKGAFQGAGEPAPPPPPPPPGMSPPPPPPPPA